MLGMFHKIRRRIYSVLLLIVFAVIAGAAVLAQGVLRNYFVSRKPAPSDQIENSLQSGPEKRLPAHVLTLNVDGFEPAEVIWEKKESLLIIDNRTPISELTFQLAKIHGARVKEIKLKTRKQRSAGVLDLPPGQYVLSEVNHTDWICHITIN